MYIIFLINIFLSPTPHCSYCNVERKEYLSIRRCYKENCIQFLGANAPIGPASSEGLYVCMSDVCMSVCLYVCMSVCNILTSPPLPSPPTNRQRDKETSRQRDKETKRQRDKEKKRQRDKKTKRQKETKRQKDEETKMTTNEISKSKWAFSLVKQLQCDSLLHKVMNKTKVYNYCNTRL